MHAEVVQVAAVVVLAVIWFMADGYARSKRRQAKRSHHYRHSETVTDRPELIDASASSASDD